jgi:hypothetical protein
MKPALHGHSIGMLGNMEFLIGAIQQLSRMLPDGALKTIRQAYKAFKTCRSLSLLVGVSLCHLVPVISLLGSRDDIRSAVNDEGC